MPTIALEHVTKYYQAGRHGWTEKQIELGVEDVSLTIEQGDFVFVIGSSGAGKSTLLDLISGQMKPDQGVVRLDGRDLSKLMRWNYTRTTLLFGKVPQEQSLIPEDDGGGEFNACRPGWKKAGIRQTITRAD